MCLGVGVLEDRPPRRLDEEHLAGAEPAPPDRVARFERHGAGLGGDGDEPVSGDGEGGGPEAIAIDQGAHPSTVGEDDRCRPVPRREHPGRSTPERGDMRVWRTTQTDGLGDGRQQRRREVPAGRGQELEPLVQGQRIRAVRGQQRTGIEQLGGDGLRAAVARPPADLLAVAADRVDLAVVGDRPERLGQPPDRCRVRGIPLVEDGVGDVELGSEIRIQVRQACPGDEALVDDRPARGRWDR